MTPVLVDDRLKTQESWEEMGGVFIFHTSAKNSIAELKICLTPRKLNLIIVSIFG
jgi:hypothetical protein